MPRYVRCWVRIRARWFERGVLANSSTGRNRRHGAYPSSPAGTTLFRICGALGFQYALKRTTRLDANLVGPNARFGIVSAAGVALDHCFDGAQHRLIKGHLLNRSQLSQSNAPAVAVEFRRACLPGRPAFVTRYSLVGVSHAAWCPDYTAAVRYGPMNPRRRARSPKARAALAEEWLHDLVSFAVHGLSV